MNVNSGESAIRWEWASVLPLFRPLMEQLVHLRVHGQ